MKASLPLTPFSTPLSGSAKEAELRLRNLFSSPKRRPPVWVLALLAVISLSCGGLVSCQSADAPSSHPQESVSLPSGDQMAARLADTRPDAYGAQLIFAGEGESCVLAAALLDQSQENPGRGDLLLGLWDGVSQDWLSPIYTIPGSAGMCASWSESDGSLHLLCTNTTQDQGLESASQVSHFRLQGRTLEEVEQLDNPLGYKAVPIPGALELYVRNPNYDPTRYGSSQSDPQWLYSHTLPFTDEAVDPVPPAVRAAAREYQASLDLGYQCPSPAATAIFQLEEAVRWDNLSPLDLDPQLQDREDLSLVCYQFSFCHPEEFFPLNTQLVFLQEGESCSYLGNFMDYSFDDLSAPGPLDPADRTRVDGLAPYNWCALHLLYEGGLLTRIPSFEEQFSQAAPAQLVWGIAAEACRDSLGTAVRTPYDPAEDPPAEGTLRLESLTPQGQRSMGDGYRSAAYTLESSQYQGGRWVPQEEHLVFLTASERWDFYLSADLEAASDAADLDRALQEHYYGLEDLEVALWDDSVSPAVPIGIGPTRAWYLTPTQTQYDQAGYVAAEQGDRYSAQFSVDEQGRRCLERLDTLRRLPTTRGIRVGDTRSQTEAAYPELRREPYPGYEGDYLWYCRQEDGSGPALLFFFTGEQLTRLVLTSS